jgi:hypothetical protein
MGGAAQGARRDMPDAITTATHEQIDLVAVGVAAGQNQTSLAHLYDAPARGTESRDHRCAIRKFTLPAAPAKLGKTMGATRREPETGL